jgi:large conductance mechanosensitive channel
MDLVIGVTVDAGFNQVVNSLVKDIILPPIGLILGHVDFSSLFLNLGSRTFAALADAKAVGAPVLSYGVFLSTLISFLLTALVIFIVTKCIALSNHDFVVAHIV